MTEENRNEKFTPAFDDLSDITHQLHNVFSKIFVNETEEADPYFSQLIKKAGHLRVDDVLTAPPVTTITSDIAIIRSAIYSFRGFAVVDGTVKPRGRHEHNSIILRDVPVSVTSSEEVIKIFTDIPNCPTPASARSDIHNTWYVAFVSEDEAKAALAFIKSITFGGKPIRARLKTDRNHNSPNRGDLPQLDVNNNGVGIAPQPFSPTYHDPASMYYPGYLPPSPQYMYPPMPFAPQYAPNGLYLDMNMPYGFPHPFMYPTYYDPYSPTHQMMGGGYGNRTPNSRGGRSNRNSGRGGGGYGNNYSSRSRDQNSPRYQKNHNGGGFNNNGNNNNAETGFAETTDAQHNENSHDVQKNDQLNNEEAGYVQNSSADIGDEGGFVEKTEGLTTEDEKVTTEVETISPPSEVSSKDQSERARQVVANVVDEVAEDGIVEAGEANKEEEKAESNKATEDKKDSKQRRERRGGERGERGDRGDRRRSKDRNERSDGYQRGKDKEKEKPKVPPPKLVMEVDFPSLNDEKKVTTAAAPATNTTTTITPSETVANNIVPEEKPQPKTSVFNYANVVRKTNAEPATAAPIPQATKNPTKEAPIAPVKASTESNTVVFPAVASVPQETVKSTSVKPHETTKTGGPVETQAKHEATPPLSFGLFGNPTNGNTNAAPSAVTQATPNKAEAINQVAVPTEPAKTADSKPVKKSFIDAVKQK